MRRGTTGNVGGRLLCGKCSKDLPRLLLAEHAHSGVEVPRRRSAFILRDNQMLTPIEGAVKDKATKESAQSGKKKACAEEPSATKAPRVKATKRQMMVLTTPGKADQARASWATEPKRRFLSLRTVHRLNPRVRAQPRGR